MSLALQRPRAGGHRAAGDYERVRDELAEALLAFTDPDTGTRPIRGRAPREQVLAGAYLDRAPDLLLEAAPLYSLTHARQIVEPADWLSGDHRPEGVYVAAGPATGAGGRIRDLAHRLRRHHRGRGRRGAGAAHGRPRSPSTAAAVFSEQEQREVEERLRGLGYLE